jgi:membrane peptidoglycan carboxypeptidase
MVPRLALARSRNVPAVGVLDRVGLDETYAFLGDRRFNGPWVDSTVYGSTKRVWQKVVAPLHHGIDLAAL